MSFRVEFGGGAQMGGAQMQFHTLPEEAKEALIERAVDLAERPWDAVVRPPGQDGRFREIVFGSGNGILGFFVDEDSEVIRIFDIVWIG